MPKTLSEKVWDQHVVHHADGEPDLLYIDLHLVHEVTSPQAFDGLRMNGRGVRRPELTVATMDHNVPTIGLELGITDPISRKQIETLAANCAEFGIRLYGMGDPGQGIVHVIGPEQGLTQPGMTIVCGDSHTSTHGAFGALAFGIGTSEVEHVLATQTLPQQRPGTMAVTVAGDLPAGVTAKDVVLTIIAQIGTGGGIGSVIEYRGSAIRRALDGGPHDDLQHVDRSRRSCRSDRARRHHVRVPRGPTVRPEGSRVGAGARRVAGAAHGRGSDVRQGSGHRRVQARTERLVGNEPRSDDDDRRGRPGSRFVHRRRSGRICDPRAPVHGTEPRARRSATSASTRSSSARARTRASRTSAPPQTSCGAARSSRGCGPWSCRARSR